MSEGSLPTPEELTNHAVAIADEHTAAGLVDDANVVNVVVAEADEFDADRTTLTDEGYDGPDATTAAHLAAACSVLGDTDTTTACLHYPEPNGTAEGPWLVLEPLAGRVATVHAGRGRLSVEVVADAALPDTLRGLLDAAALDHEHYPVEADEHGVFTTGMETADLRSVDRTPGGGARVEFDVSVTPATTAAGVESRFGDVDGVDAASFEVLTSVERASPPTALRQAVQDAHVEVTGDCEYEWGPEPSVFSHIPGGQKVAFGTAQSGADTVDVATVDSCSEILRRTLRDWSESVADGAAEPTEVDR